MINKKKLNIKRAFDGLAYLHIKTKLIIRKIQIKMQQAYVQPYAYYFPPPQSFAQTPYTMPYQANHHQHLYHQTAFQPIYQQHYMPAQIPQPTTTSTPIPQPTTTSSPIPEETNLTSENSSDSSPSKHSSNNSEPIIVEDSSLRQSLSKYTNLALKTGQTFKSFEEFYDLANEYWTQTYQILTKVKAEYIITKDPSSGYKRVEFACIHHQKEKDIKTKSNGVRPTQRYLAKGCQVYYKIILSNQGKTKGLYVIKNWEAIHNHECTEEDFKLNSKNRKLNEEEVNEAILMINNKVKVMKIFIILNKRK
jgi:hypothetical protein